MLSMRKSDRTSVSSSPANFVRLLLAGAASVLHLHLRVLGLYVTGLASAQPRTIILSMFKIAVCVKQYKNRVLLHPPSACPIRALLANLSTTRFNLQEIRHAGPSITWYAWLTRRCSHPSQYPVHDQSCQLGVGEKLLENQKIGEQQQKCVAESLCNAQANLLSC
jgi:hypothetical protein